MQGGSDLLGVTGTDLEHDLQQCDFRVGALTLISVLRGRTARVTCLCGSQLGAQFPGCVELGAVLPSQGQTPLNGDWRIQGWVPQSSPVQPGHVGDVLAVAWWLVSSLLKLPGSLGSCNGDSWPAEH